MLLWWLYCYDCIWYCKGSGDGISVVCVTHHEIQLGFVAATDIFLIVHACDILHGKCRRNTLPHP